MDKSIVLPAFFPETIDSIDKMKEALDYLLKFDIKWIEFYYKKNKSKKLKDLLKEYDYSYIYLGAMHAKINNLNISSINDSIRNNSIEQLKLCIDNTKYYGAKKLLINSGRRPENESKIKEAFQLLVNSLENLIKYNINYNNPIQINLEPGDDNIDSFSLIGKSDLALNLLDKVDDIKLTLDISHILQLKEDPITVIDNCLNYTDHIHLANCVINNKKSKLYGDKHPMFDEIGGELSTEEINNLYNYIKEKYLNKKIIIGIEVINREDTGINFLNKYKDKFNWFFKS